MARTTQDRIKVEASQDPGFVSSLAPPEQTEQQDFSEEGITARATTITLVLEQIIAQRSFPHGGINE